LELLFENKVLSLAIAKKYIDFYGKDYPDATLIGDLLTVRDYLPEI
jgi:hypothetical protein